LGIAKLAGTLFRHNRNHLAVGKAVAMETKKFAQQSFDAVTLNSPADLAAGSDTQPGGAILLF
jgi:hypothetical protein